MKITLKVTPKEFDHIIRGLSYTMEDFMDDYEDWQRENNNRVRKENAKIQKFIDKLIEQAKG